MCAAWSYLIKLMQMAGRYSPESSCPIRHNVDIAHVLICSSGDTWIGTARLWRKTMPRVATKGRVAISTSTAITKDIFGHSS